MALLRGWQGCGLCAALRATLTTMLGIPQKNQVQILRPWPLPFQIRVHLPPRAACPAAAAAQTAAAEGACGKWGGTSRGWAGLGTGRLRLILPPLLQVFIPSSSDSSDEEDDVYDWALTLAMLDTDHVYASYLHELLVVDLSDSD